MLFLSVSLPRLPKHHSSGGLNNKFLFPPSSGSWKSKVRVAAWLGSGKDAHPGLQMAGHLLVFPPGGESTLWHLLLQGHQPDGLGPHP